jgi:hypothetical protein
VLLKAESSTDPLLLPSFARRGRGGWVDGPRLSDQAGSRTINHMVKHPGVESSSLYKPDIFNFASGTSEWEHFLT